MATNKCRLIELESHIGWGAKYLHDLKGSPHKLPVNYKGENSKFKMEKPGNISLTQWSELTSALMGQSVSRQCCSCPLYKTLV